MSLILFIHENGELLNKYGAIIKRLGHQCLPAHDVEEATGIIRESNPDLIFVQLDLPEAGGYTVQEMTLSYNPNTPVIFTTAKADVNTAVRALKSGAFDYIELPLSAEDISRLIAETPAHQFRTPPKEEQSVLENYFYHLDKLVCMSSEMQRVAKRVLRVSKTDANVFISGESGTGKELLAKSIHHYSKRTHKPFIPVDCVALPNTLLESELFGFEKGAFTGAMSSKPGLIELADGGTLFLDEITELDLYLQAKLLRVIQERQFRRVGGNKLIQVDIRIISASNWDPMEAVEKRQLRQDLFYRLHVVPITLPPLRVRNKDLPILINQFIQKFNIAYKTRPVKISQATIERMSQYNWPGNVRELQNVIEQLVSLADHSTIGEDDLPDHILNYQGQSVEENNTYDNMSFKSAKDKYMRQFCTDYFSHLLEKHNGNISQVAKEAKLSRSTIYKLMQESDVTK